MDPTPASVAERRKQAVTAGAALRKQVHDVFLVYGSDALTNEKESMDIT